MLFCSLYPIQEEASKELGWQADGSGVGGLFLVSRGGRLQSPLGITSLGMGAR